MATSNVRSKHKRMFHYGKRTTTGLKLHQQKKSTGRSESSSDKTKTSPVTKKKFKIGSLGDFEKSAFLYFHPSQYNLAPGIKGATDQMLPWKAPTDLKTLPMGILHEYMLYWTTLGPFGYPRGPQNGPKQYQNGPEWLKITRMAQNGTAWPQMTLKHFPWVYYMNICHVGPPWGHSGTHGGPKMAQNSTKMA